MIKDNYEREFVSKAKKLKREPQNLKDNKTHIKNSDDAITAEDINTKGGNGHKMVTFQLKDK